MIRSLRWRLQVWHALVLAIVLTVFGVFVYDLQWQSRLQQTDAELDRTAEVLTSRLRRLLGAGRPFWPPGPWTGFDRSPPRAKSDPEQKAPRAKTKSANGGKRGPADDELKTAPRETTNLARGTSHAGPESKSPAARQAEKRAAPRRPLPTIAGLGLPEEFLQLFEGDRESRLYFLVWSGNGQLLQKSKSAPRVAFPDLKSDRDGLPLRVARTRGDWREIIHVPRFSIHVLVGRSLVASVREQHASGVRLGLAGLGMLLVGLMGGYAIASRAIRPIAAMSVSAASISARNLATRINVSATDDELGQLATVLNRTFDRLEAAFEQQSRFTADASHELRTPLAVVLTQTEFALGRERSSAEYKSALAACARASQRMKSLIESLLLLARFDAGEPTLDEQAFDLDRLLQESVELIQPLAEPKRIVIQCQSRSLTVKADRERLGQVFSNLLSNAIRYNHEGGRVDVSIGADEQQVLIQVSDTGLGIDADDQQHVFERFYRVDRARSRAVGGSGLGLAICKSIVEAHHGRISIASRVGQGTTVEVRLPIAVGAHQNAARADGESRGGNLAGPLGSRTA